MPEKPASEKKMLEQVWYGLFGTPGSAGVVDRVTRIETALNGSGKKPLKTVALSILGGMVALETIGMLEPLKATVYAWLTGGAG